MHFGLLDNITSTFVFVVVIVQFAAHAKKHNVSFEEGKVSVFIIATDSLCFILLKNGILVYSPPLRPPSLPLKFRTVYIQHYD